MRRMMVLMFAFSLAYACGAPAPESEPEPAPPPPAVEQSFGDTLRGVGGDLLRAGANEAANRLERVADAGVKCAENARMVDRTDPRFTPVTQWDEARLNEAREQLIACVTAGLPGFGLALDRIEAELRRR